MANTISALTGVTWTDLNGTGLTGTDVTNQTTLIQTLSNSKDYFTKFLNLMSKTGDTPMSLNDLFSNSTEFFSQADALAALHARGTGKTTYIDDNGVRHWIAQTSTLAFETTVPNGTLTANAFGPAQSSYYNLPMVTNSAFSPSSIDKNLLLQYLAANSPVALTANTKLNYSGWQNVLAKLSNTIYQEASKLDAAHGGGLKTYGGKWYANGQEVSYLDITFAVRVNQLFVINNTINQYLSQVQKNNVRIKNANLISAIFADNSPTSSTGTVNVSSLVSQILKAGFANGFITSYAAQYNQKTDPTGVTNAIANETFAAVLYTSALDGQNYWAIKQNGVLTTKQATLANTQAVVAMTQTTGTTTTNIKILGMYIDATNLISMMPTGISKIFDTSTGLFKNTATLTQADCTALTTELKSYTSSLDADSQTAQTQLDQYNNKRTESLDGITNVVKGSNTALNDISRNLGQLL